VNKLAKTAAVATIVGAAFTVVAYFSQIGFFDKKKTNIPDTPSDSSSITQPIKQEDTAIQQPTIQQNIETPQNIENSITIDQLSARYETALKIPYTGDKITALFELVKIAVTNNYFIKAIEIAESIPYTGTKSDALALIARAAVKINPNIAVEAAEKIPYVGTKSEVLKEIATQ
jgi:hypothetical protein